jgi:hypothetical protein
MDKLNTFNAKQLKIVNQAISSSEDLVSNAYKMSASQWRRLKYDIKTLLDLTPEEVIPGPFAQIIRYKGQPKDTSLGSSSYDFYKICLQDYTILSAVKESPQIKLFPFMLYIISHELIHIVRFSQFLQNFDASLDERLTEEARVHQKTHHILRDIQVDGLDSVLEYYEKWQLPFEKLQNP